MSELYFCIDVVLVTSLRDGMNLVSYEYVACQHMKNTEGVLVLSEVSLLIYNLNLFKLQEKTVSGFVVHFIKFYWTSLPFDISLKEREALKIQVVRYWSLLHFVLFVTFLVSVTEANILCSLQEQPSL